MKRRIYTVDAIPLGATLPDVVALKGAAKSRCWITEDRVTRLVYPDLVLHFDEQEALLEIRGGKVLIFDGGALKSGDPERSVEEYLGQPDELLEDDWDDTPYEFQMRSRDYRGEGYTLRVMTDGGKVFDFWLRVNRQRWN